MDLAKHAARLAALDPLLPEPADLEGTVLVTDSAVGAVSLVSVEPDSFDALWGALNRHRLTVRLPGAELGPLLDRWTEHLRETVPPGDPEHAAMITWPSRDTGPVRELALRGFAPLLALAARRRGAAAAPPPANDLVIRDVTMADLGACGALWAAIVRYDHQFGVVTARPGFEESCRAHLAEQLGVEGRLAWLAERDGEVLGLLTVDLPPHSDWAAELTSASPVAYLGATSVATGSRGRGIGSALVAHAHRVLDEAGVELTILHHAVPNPRSAPFWAAQGYRPLWTIWQRRPALPA
ncbi:GNAT superfamily N-acetyltransferase [Kutzneria viridogrisea]|nr:GNAT family N-acetyltransferase [Kutzneria albida]MBA8931585.1 GNAT superfamily N-acetyltransferase [Kutzneria viridogrisea]